MICALWNVHVCSVIAFNFLLLVSFNGYMSGIEALVYDVIIYLNLVSPHSRFKLIT